VHWAIFSRGTKATHVFHGEKVTSHFAHMSRTRARNAMRNLHQLSASPLGGLDPRRAAVSHMRHAEAQDRHSRYYATHPADPHALRKTQPPDFVDAWGRRYRIANEGHRGGLSGDLVSLDVKEVKGHQALDESHRVRMSLDLLDPRGSGDTDDEPVRVTLAMFGIREPQRRVWQIEVRGLDSHVVAAVLARRPKDSVA